MRRDPEKAMAPVAKTPLHGSPVARDKAEVIAALHRSGRTTDREHLLERLQHLRGILPVFAQELASARRQAAALRVENRGLLEEVRRLRARDRRGVSTGR
jgi:hypothetical protein